MKLGTKLLLSGIGLMALPWLGYQYLSDMRSFLVTGQERAQLLAAQAVATSLQNRDELFEGQDNLPRSFEENTLYVHPLRYFIQIDGYKQDWEKIADKPRHFAADFIIKSMEHYDPENFSFDLVLGQRENYLYSLLEVKDSTPVYRHPRYHRLDNSDHVRFATMDETGRIHRYIITTEGIGFISAYQVDRNWKYPVTGRPVPGVLGFWRESLQGYTLEFRMPLSLIGNQNRFDLAVANIKDKTQRQVETIIGTLPAKWSKELNHIVFRSPELTRIIAGLKRPGTNIWVVDRYSRVRAHVADQAFYTRDAKKRTGTAIQQALKGEPATQRFRPAGNSAKEIIVAAYPIRSQHGVLGAVAVELPTDEILALQRKTLEKSAAYTALVILVVVAGLLLFSSRLTFRIQKLRREVTEIIDPNGRIQSNQPLSYSQSMDEIGELSRTICSMLARLQDYTEFLERMPKTLKHEINNPLNTISTSLQNLAVCEATSDQIAYLESAERGIAKLSNIVQSIADAASLEDALRNEDFQSINLSEIVNAYVDSCGKFNRRHRFELITIDQPVYIRGNDFRLEQLLDKLVDNAVDSSPPDSTIQFKLFADNQFVSVSISNEGPLLPENIRRQLFDSMVSYRDRNANTKSPHLGIGLFIVRTIAEFHDAKVIAENRKDQKGVMVTVTFPILLGIQ